MTSVIQRKELKLQSSNEIVDCNHPWIWGEKPTNALTRNCDNDDDDDGFWNDDEFAKEDDIW